MTSPASVVVDGDRVTARLGVAQRGVAAGQALVMYDGDVVLGSATITAARRAADVAAGA
jgi:tRNA-specific 2-thiouridylase